MKCCYYELLGVSETCTSTELKKAYRSKALLFHPDKNRDNIEEANQKFQAISQAFQVLNDPQEREWYDSHKAQILREDSDRGSKTEGDENVADFYYGLTVDDLLKYFSSSIYAPANWFESIALLFARIADEEQEACTAQKLKPSTFPKFGIATSDYQREVKDFYKVWSSFQTVKTFAWYDQYRYSSQQDRKTRRLVEKENKKIRDQAKKEYNETIRHLVSFVKKRDQRVKLGLQKMEEEKQNKAAMNAAKKNKKSSAQTQFASQDWMENDELYREIEQAWLEQELNEPKNDEEDDTEQFECIICNKFFKSESQFKAHEASKKHIKAFRKLRYEMRKEGIELGIDQDTLVTEEIESEGFVTADEEIHPYEDVIDEADDINEVDGVIQEEMYDVTEKEDVAKASKFENEIDDEFDDEVDDEVDVGEVEGTKVPEVDDEIDEELLEMIEALNRKTKIEDSDDDDWSALKNKKKTKKKGKQASRDTTPRETTPVLKETCNVCRAAFTSRTKLFQHVSETGHALAGKSKKKRK